QRSAGPHEPPAAAAKPARHRAASAVHRSTRGTPRTDEALPGEILLIVTGLGLNRSIRLAGRVRQQQADRLPWSTCVPLLIILSLLGWGLIAFPIAVILENI